MKQTSQQSTLVSHNVTIDGRRTSIRLEPYMWAALKEICDAESLSIHEFCSRVDSCREQSALTAAIRVAITAYFREKMHEFADYIQEKGLNLHDRDRNPDGGGKPPRKPSQNGAPLPAAAKSAP